MAGLQKLVQGLRRAELELETQLAGIKAAISSLAGNATGRRQGRPAGSQNKGAEKGIIIVGGKKKRKMSAAARRAISLAQKARWAKQKASAKK